MNVNKLIADIKELNSKSKFRLEFDASGGFVEFYNTSGKSFVLGLKSIKSVLEDIDENIEVFKVIKDYDEKPWRDAASTYYRDDAANAIATVQTKPLYATISKFVAIANNALSNYSDDQINVEHSKLSNTIKYLEELIGLFRIDLGKVDSASNVNQRDLKHQFATWLVSAPSNNYFDNNIDRALKGLTQYQEKYQEVFDEDIFDVDISNIEASIEKIRDNIYDRSSGFWEYSKNISTHQPKAILGDRNYLKFLREYVYPSVGDLRDGYNKIYFGSPGTGKSYKVAQLLKGIDEAQIERVTFHPDYDYASFVGGYKPVSEHGENGEDVVKYKFVPQVFINVYERAHRNPNRNYYLVIEEINRGNCAEIFGDIFQLLDRNPDYAITPAEDLLKYLLKRDANSQYKALRGGKMIMPNNLIILATMNTSDQSLYPMDSAFKRRWDWEYVPISYPKGEDDSSCPSFKYRVRLDDKHYFSWISFVAGVNKYILENPSLGLDKCIGNFFTKPEFGDNIPLEMIINKVMFYLWNDVFKDEENEIFIDHTYLDYFPIHSNGRERLRTLVEKLEVTLETEPVEIGV